MVMTLGLSWAAGLHAALLGAWKDSPFESFKPGSFVRELLIATFVGLALCRVDHLASPFLIFLSAFTLCRIVTEFYKMFVRNDRQDIYRIPTQVHWVGTVLSRPMRLVLGVGWLGAIYGLFCLLTLLPPRWSPTLIGFFVLGAIACERMLTELFFKVLRPGYVGGHFKSTEPAFPEWVTRRRVFVVPYVLTWALFVGLWVSGR
jgi:hypothetical protein